ncbi:MAG: prolyl oligopeptidase family serine peptidase [Pseudomonadota bacterium]
MTKLDGPRRPAKAGKADALIVFIHGYGADGNDLIALADVFAPQFPGAAFASPHAPGLTPMGGRQWFPLTMRDPSEYKRGVEAAAPALNAFFDDELQRLGLPQNRLVIVGFSQGTMMGLHVGLRRAVAPAAIVGFSGLCADPAATDLNGAPTLLVHGTADEVLPAALTVEAAQALGTAGVPVEWHLVPGLGHGIEQTGLAFASGHIRQGLAPK